VARGRAAVTVDVDKHVATLGGTVGSYAEKAGARRAAARVPGIEAIEDAIVVTPEPGETKSDAELERMGNEILAWDGRVPARAVRVAVRGGRVRLSGTVDHDDERAAAEAAVARLIGVRDVANEIVLRPVPPPPHARGRIEEELARRLGPEARHVKVVVDDRGVTLKGRLATLALRHAAERAVRRVLGDVPLELRLA
jgi:osmotically-inducible protein OsmY